MPALTPSYRRADAISRLLPRAPRPESTYRPGHLTQVLALVARACHEDLPRVADPQGALAFARDAGGRAPREDELTLHVGFDRETDLPLTVVVGPCKTAAVYVDGQFVGLADAEHPRFVANLTARRIPVPLPADYRIGQSAPSLQLVHRT